MSAAGKTPRAKRPATAKDAPPSAWDSFNEICSVRIEWLDGYDPAEIEELPLKIALGRITNRRNAARKRLTKTTD